MSQCIPSSAEFDVFWLVGVKRTQNPACFPGYSSGLGLLLIQDTEDWRYFRSDQSQLHVFSRKKLPMCLPGHKLKPQVLLVDFRSGIHQPKSWNFPPKFPEHKIIFWSETKKLWVNSIGLGISPIQTSQPEQIEFIWWGSLHGITPIRASSSDAVSICGSPLRSVISPGKVVYPIFPVCKQFSANRIKAIGRGHIVSPYLLLSFHVQMHITQDRAGEIGWISCVFL